MLYSQSNNAKINSPYRVGLALSGGGFRASLYHLGTIRYLEECGIMPHIEVMSTVSGGSIIGAYYLVEMERRLRTAPNLDRLTACDEIISDFCAKLKLNFRMRGLIFYPYFHPLLTVLSLIRLRHRGDTMAKAFERYLFAPNLRIGDLPVQTFNKDTKALDGTRLLMNTTSLITGRRFVLSRECDTGLKAQIIKSNSNNIILARAVGASAAVPGLFRPLRIGNELLSDGAVVDNQGIESLFDYFQLSESALNLLPDSFRQPKELRQITKSADGNKYIEKPSGKIHLIISDAENQLIVKPDIPPTIMASSVRTLAIMSAANRRKLLKLLLDKKQDGSISDFCFTHIAMNLKGRDPTNDTERLPSEFITATAEVRSDLDEFSRLERDVLIYHGYTLMKSQMQTHCQKLLNLATLASASTQKNVTDSKHFSWPPPFISLYDPKKLTREKAIKARTWIAKYLSNSNARGFRDVKRFPYLFGPLLALFIALTYELIRTPLVVGTIENPGLLKEWISTQISVLFTAMIPNINIPNLFDLRLLVNSLTYHGEYWGIISLISTIMCVFLSFYISMFLYWNLKRITRLSEHTESIMLGQFKQMEVKGVWKRLKCAFTRIIKLGVRG